MANYGFIVEKQLMADDIGTLNKSATCTTNVDGGNLVTLGAYTDGSYAVTLGTAGAALGFWMAYNPTEHLTSVNGKLFAGLTKDPRDYTNNANRQFDIFKPQVEDIIGFTTSNITGSAPTVGQFLEPAANGTVGAKSSQTADSTSFKVVSIEKLPFPKADIGMEMANLYVCKCVAN